MQKSGSDFDLTCRLNEDISIHWRSENSTALANPAEAHTVRLGSAGKIVLRKPMARIRCPRPDKMCRGGKVEVREHRTRIRTGTRHDGISSLRMSR